MKTNQILVIMQNLGLCKYLAKIHRNTLCTIYNYPSKYILSAVHSASKLNSEVNKDEPNSKVNDVKKKDILKFTKKCPEKVNVAIIGADEKPGRVLAFQLKQHPLIKKLFLHGRGCMNLAEDLEQIDTFCLARGFENEKEIPKCLKVCIFFFRKLF